MSKKGKLLRGEKGEEKVFEVLKSNPSNFFIINNLVLVGENGMSHQSDHIIIRDNGIFIIETKNYYGEIIGGEKDSTWVRIIDEPKKKEKDYFRNPLLQNKSHIKSVKKIIGDTYPIYGFVVFVKNNVSNLELFNVVGIDEINKRMNLLTIDKTIPKDTQKKIYNMLLYSEADVNQEMHIKKINQVKQERKDYQNEARKAIETRICPICGNKLLLDKNGLKCSSCSYKIKV